MLSITNNIASLTAQNSLNNTSSMLATSLQRLSTGLKINSGADGPAALVISEEQKAQISGLQTAITNTSKAVSLVQTTEGALNEVNSLLTQIRSLALDAANSAVNDSSALAADQAQVSNALATIDRIATNTQFGTKKLLDGTLGATVTDTDVSNPNITSQVTTGLTNANLANGDYKLKITTAFVPAVLGSPATSTNTIQGATNAATFFSTAGPGAKAGVGPANVNVTGGTAGTFFNDAAAGGGADVDASAVKNADYFSDAGNLNVGGIDYAYTSSSQVGAVLNTINADATNHFTIALDDTTGQFTVTAKNDGTADNGSAVTFTGATYTGDLGATTTGGVNDGAAVDASAVQNSSHFTENGTIVVGNNSYNYTAADTVGSVLANITTNDANFSITLNDNNSKFTVTAKANGAAQNGVQVQFLGANHSAHLDATAGGATATAKTDAAGEITDSAGNSLATPVLLTAVPASDGTVLQNTTLGIQFDVDNTAAQTTGDKGIVFNVSSTGAAAVFQIGANAGQTASLSVANSGTAQLGTGVLNNMFASLGAIDVTTEAGAQDALAVIDKSIGQISTQRAGLGAFQTNTLQANAASLTATLTNTTAAESVIADTDFAAETANFTKSQVLMQVGTTVLQQANATSQLILGLLK